MGFMCKCDGKWWRMVDEKKASKTWQKNLFSKKKQSAPMDGYIKKSSPINQVDTEYVLCILLIHEAGRTKSYRSEFR